MVDSTNTHQITIEPQQSGSHVNGFVTKTISFARYEANGISFNAHQNVEQAAVTGKAHAGS